jgi:hypothetical protein
MKFVDKDSLDALCVAVERCRHQLFDATALCLEPTPHEALDIESAALAILSVLERAPVVAEDIMFISGLGGGAIFFPKVCVSSVRHGEPKGDRLVIDDPRRADV